MNKFAIPAILTATVLLAGIFAFSPVEQASTVHTTIQTAVGTQQAEVGVIAADADGASTTTLTCDAAFEVTQITVQTIGTVDAAETVDVDFDVDGAGANWTVDVNYIAAVNVSDNENTALMNDDSGATGPIIATTDGRVIVTLNADANGGGNDDDNEGLRAMFMVKSGGTCSTS